MKSKTSRRNNDVHHLNSLDSPLRPHRDDIFIHADGLTSTSPTLLLGIKLETGVLNLQGTASGNDQAMTHAVWQNTLNWTATGRDRLQPPLRVRAAYQAVILEKLPAS